MTFHYVCTVSITNIIISKLDYACVVCGSCVLSAVSDISGGPVESSCTPCKCSYHVKISHTHTTHAHTHVNAHAHAHARTRTWTRPRPHTLVFLLVSLVPKLFLHVKSVQRERLLVSLSPCQELCKLGLMGHRVKL